MRSLLSYLYYTYVREKGLEPSRPKTQVPKTCVSAISPLPLTQMKNFAAIHMAAQVDKNEVIPRQVIELITTGKSAGVQAPAANKGAK